MNNERLPPNQHEIKNILRWNIDHNGIILKNPEINFKNWTLTVNGEIENYLVLNWQDLLNLPSIESMQDFHCVEGWSVRKCRWQGVKMSTILEIVEPKREAEYALFKCLDSYSTSIELEYILKKNVILAYKLNGLLLETSLGGPVRLIVPDKYSYKSAMWIREITITCKKELGYWEKRGYSDTADVWKNDRFAKS